MEPLRYICDGKRHLVCEPCSVYNLHRMAAELKIGRAWFHPGDKPHYDIPYRRQTEILAKCQQVSPRQILSIIRGFQLLSDDHVADK